jgi:hypothetical protein
MRVIRDVTVKYHHEMTATREALVEELRDFTAFECA